MNELDARCLDQFPAWLRTLGDDAKVLVGLLEAELDASVRHELAAALTYLLKSVDLIPDGLEELGFLDDAFVLRVAAERVPSEARAADASGTLARLAGEAELVRELLAADYANLEAYVAKLAAGRVRGRSVSEVLADADARREFSSDILAWSQSYSTPPFARDEKNLLKLRAFLRKRLSP